MILPAAAPMAAPLNVAINIPPAIAGPNPGMRRAATAPSAPPMSPPPAASAAIRSPCSFSGSMVPARVKKPISSSLNPARRSSSIACLAWARSAKTPTATVLCVIAMSFSPWKFFLESFAVATTCTYAGTEKCHCRDLKCAGCLSAFRIGLPGKTFGRFAM